MAANNEMLLALTADIVAAHAGHNSVPMNDLPAAIANVYTALAGLGEPAAPAQPEKPVGAVSIRASIKPQHIVSMIDGQPYKMLKRHLSLNGYTPESYREAFGLPRDYPMVSAEYSEKRKALALKIGLGRKPKGAAPAKAAAPASKAVRKPRASKAAATEA
jgi:predicted transcriptional regulator